MNPPARDAGAEAGTQTAPDLTAGTTPGSTAAAAAASSSGPIGSADLFGDGFEEIELRGTREGRLKELVRNPRTLARKARAVPQKRQSQRDAKEQFKKERQEDYNRSRTSARARDRRSMNRDVDEFMPPATGDCKLLRTLCKKRNE